MKIFVPTSTHPSKNSTSNIIIKNILKNLKLIDSTSCIWFLYTSQIFEKTKNFDETIIDIHDYTNAIDVLVDCKPDCVITENNKFSTIDNAFNLAAKFLNIPLIHFKINDFNYSGNSKSSSQIISNFKRNIKKIILKDSETKQNHIFFILYKNKFLYETEKKLNTNTIQNLKSQIDNIIFHFVGNLEKRFSNLADLNIVNNEMWLNTFRKYGIDEKKIVLTGNPYWDKYFHIFNQTNFSKEPIHDQPIKILIITTPLVEHGHWSEQERDQIISNLINILSKKNEFLFSFKIHPTSESTQIYKNYIKKMNTSSKIYQNESLWEIIENYDLIISYGFSMIHTEIALAGCKMILFNLNNDFKIMPLVNSAIDSGFIEKCNKFEDLSEIIKNLAKKEIKLKSNYDNEIRKYFYKFDGNSGMRAAKAIHKIIKKNH
jgi:hypothetical protein